mmetsp:Transcript_1158/g.3210  ORF Transcript_1158/g.3210 Transcript_1158/m.3210 type:complete len:130 (+) Transcript_1158:796-1185(+)
MYLDVILCCVDNEFDGSSGGAVHYSCFEGEEDDDEEELLVVEPASNSLSLVLRDAQTYRHVKFVNCTATGPRGDCVACFRVQPSDDDDDDESSESGEESDDGSGSDSGESADSYTAPTAVHTAKKARTG